MAIVHDKEESYKSAVERAREFGIDISLIEENLKRTPSERLESMISMLEFTDEARVSLARQRDKRSE